MQRGCVRALPAERDLPEEVASNRGFQLEKERALCRGGNARKSSEGQAGRSVVHREAERGVCLGRAWSLRWKGAGNEPGGKTSRGPEASQGEAGDWPVPGAPDARRGVKQVALSVSEGLTALSKGDRLQ